MPISVLPLNHDDFLLALLNGSLRFDQLLCPCLRIKHVGDGSVSWNGLNGGLHAGVETLFSEERQEVSRGMKAVVVGKLS